MTPEIERLVENLMPQARSEAWRRYQAAPQQLDLDELVSLASTGLAMAGARWERYCSENDYDPGATQYFAAYALRRMRGAMLDYMRSADWVTRSVRSRAKALRQAGQDLGASAEELGTRTGLSAQQISDTLAAVARRPVSMDAEPVDIADSDDVEGQAVVNSVLVAAVGALRKQPLDVQAVLALRYHQGKELREIAVLIGRTEAETAELHTTGILAVHAAMVAAVAEPPSDRYNAAC
jgi:RNA polymerase sigma factor FliA